MRYQASCHCGQNRLSFEGDINEVLACNCSMCQRRGSLRTETRHFLWIHREQAA